MTIKRASPYRFWSSKKGEGETFKWLLAHASYDSDECLIWPYSIDNYGGYGHLGYNGKMYLAHRLMCILAHGEPPTPKHQASHSCGKGHEGCVNPKHISWKTTSDNLKDRRKHGTHKGAIGNRTNLPYGVIDRIRELKGVVSQYKISAIFKVAPGCVQYWHRDDHPPAA